MQVCLQGDFDLGICPVSMGAGDHLPPYVCYMDENPVRDCEARES